MDSIENAQNVAIIKEKLNNLEDRVTELAGNYNALSKSFFVLNENHHQINIDNATLRAELKTVKTIIMWVISPSAVFAFIIQLAKLCELI